MFVEEAKEPTLEEYKELASCLHRLKQNQDFKKVFMDYLFGTFLNMNTDRIVEPVQPEQNNHVRISIRNIQNINWLKSLLEYIESTAKDAIKEEEKKVKK